MDQLKKKFRLRNDVVSHFNPYQVYGTADTEVTILHYHLDMMIVQDDLGNIFHSRTDNLYEKIGSIGIEARMKTIKPVKQIEKIPRSRKKILSPINQTDLFK